MDSKLEDEEMESKRKRGVTRDKTAPHSSISSSSRPMGVSHSSIGPDTHRQYSSSHTVHKSYSHGPFSSPVNSNPYRTSHSQSWTRDGTSNDINRVDTSALLSSVYRGPSPSTRDIPSLSSTQQPLFNHRYPTISDSYSRPSVSDPLTSDLRPTVKPVTRKIHSKTGSRVTTTSVHTEPRINLPRGMYCVQYMEMQMLLLSEQAYLHMYMYMCLIDCTCMYYMYILSHNYIAKTSYVDFKPFLHVHCTCQIFTHYTQYNYDLFLFPRNHFKLTRNDSEAEKRSG